MSDRAWRTCSPTRSRRTDRPSSSWLWRIAPIHHSVVTPAKAGMPISKRPRAFLDLERLDHVADLDVVRVLKPDAAFQTGAHLVDVIIDAPQRSTLPGVDYDIVPYDARLEVAPDLAFLHPHASRLAMLSGLSDVTHSGTADN